MNESAAKWVSIDKLMPWADNPRINEHAVDDVARSIKRFGFASPIIAREENNEVIAGHTRLKAAVKLGLDRVPVRFMDLDPADARMLALADNRVGELAEWDDGALSAILKELDADGLDLDSLGWKPDELQMILSGANSVAEGEWDDAFGDLAEGDRAPIQQMAFTLHDEQVEIVKAALSAAKSLGDFADTGNENSNGNALARICETFVRVSQ